MGLAQQVAQIWLAMVGGSGVRITKYPIDAVGTTLTASGMTTGAYKFAAASANVKSIVAKATILVNYRIIGVALDTPSAVAIEVIRIGTGTAAGAALVVAFEAVMEVATDAGGYVSMIFPATFTQSPDGVNDLVGGDLASSNAAADDTANVSVLIQTGLGS